MSITPLVILAGIIAGITVRQVGRVRLQIWQVMGVGAIAMLVTASLSPIAAFRAIDWDVLLFLFGMFVLARALEESGLLAALTYRAVRNAASADMLLVTFILVVSIAGALLMNDTLAVVGTPVAIALARTHRLPPQLLLLALAFAVTTGGVVSPIGNPQNLLIALHGGFYNPFGAFFGGLVLPTIVGLVFVYVVVRVAYRADIYDGVLSHEPTVIGDRALARVAGAALALLLGLVLFQIVWLTFIGHELLRPTVIALLPAAVILVGSARRVEIVRGVDWQTLAFFVSLFIVVAGVAHSGVVGQVVESLGSGVARPPIVLAVSTLLSQVVSNVPLAALYLPFVSHAASPVHGLLALAAGSTIAGNLTVLGAASNVIIVDVAERRYGVRIGFVEFLRLGVLLTAIQVAVFALFLR